MGIRIPFIVLGTVLWVFVAYSAHDRGPLPWQIEKRGQKLMAYVFLAVYIILTAGLMLFYAHMYGL